ncbi:MAG: ABC transporter substrate-binding protein [Xenococcus sp. MO_188.B8]|nr:ABC transporter substrate-binding protein [Xenococcus sp. MO_188.B8]
MERRKFLTKTLTNTALGAIGATALGACTSESQQRKSVTIPNTPNIDVNQPLIRWRMATSWPKSLQILFEAADLLCQQVNIMTNGRFVITPYPAGELTDGLKVLPAVQDNIVECGHTASYYYLDYGSALAFGTTLPFGLTASQQNAWLYYGGGLEAMRKLYQDLGIVNFPGGNTGTQMGGWFKQEVKTIADFQGLRMRVPGLGGKILQRLGVEIQSLPGNRIFTALEQNIIDAAEWKNPHADQTLGLNKVAPYYYYPGWWEPGTSYEFQINLAEWNKLPVEYQEIFQAAATDVNTKMLAKFNAVNGKVLEQLVLTGTKLLPFSSEILQASYKEAFAMYEEMATEDENFRNLYLQWQKFRNQIYAWNEINESVFANFALNNIKFS